MGGGTQNKKDIHSDALFVLVEIIELECPDPLEVARRGKSKTARKRKKATSNDVAFFWWRQQNSNL